MGLIDHRDNPIDFEWEFVMKQRVDSLPLIWVQSLNNPFEYSLVHHPTITTTRNSIDSMTR